MRELNLPARVRPARVLDSFQIGPNQRRVLADLPGPGCIRHIWMTLRPRPLSNRDVILRITWDDEPAPSVECPLGDFFGLCHGIPHYPINSLYLSVQEQSGYNAYFPMPFARSARIEIETGPRDAAGFFHHIDWSRFLTPLDEPYRFHAAWRRECPTEAFGEDYLVLDAVGRGRLLGLVYGVRLLDDADRWSHGGAENLYIDGEATGDDGVEPVFIRGSGGEDTFGVSYGGALHRPETHLYAGIPYYTHEDVGQARPAQRLAAYRWFEHDAIPFERSLHFRFGCVANDICSTVYWYQSEPHRPFSHLPDWDHLHPGVELPRDATVRLGQADPPDGDWWLCGPFAPADDPPSTSALPPEAGATPDPDVRYDGGFAPESPWRSAGAGRPDQHLAHWVRRKATHGFVDFAHVFRPWTRGVAVAWPARACALTTVIVAADTLATVHLAWDDELTLRLNDEPPRSLGVQPTFRRRAVTVQLRAGANRLLLTLTNTKGVSWGAWCFACSVVEPGGRVLPPTVP